MSIILVITVAQLTLLAQNPSTVSTAPPESISLARNLMPGLRGDTLLNQAPDNLLRYHLKNLELSPDSITAITFDRNGQIWMGSRDGLRVIEGARYRSYTYKDGLFDKDIHDLFVSEKGDLWVATSSGPFAFLDNHFYVFEPLKNYHILAISEDPDNMLFLSKSGLHTFKKEKRLFETVYIKIGFLAVLLFVLSAFIIWVIKRFKTNVEWKANLIKVEQDALLAQMNPHFIFNSLNSVQRYIMANDKDSAHTYLQKFANMMRKVLENSNQPTIALSEEIATLDLYLQIESLRFDNGFDYEITVKDKDIYYIEIPTMLIQTFVENAVWHGLMKKEERGKINLRFSRIDNKRIVCEIEDNGIGRKKAAEYKSKDRVPHRSKGTEIVNKRIALMNLKTRNKIVCETIDLEKENSQQTGTLVRLEIPIELS